MSITFIDRPNVNIVIPYKAEANTRLVTHATKNDVWAGFADYLRFSISEIREARARTKKSLRALN